jgi:hypothetical protein
MVPGTIQINGRKALRLEPQLQSQALISTVKVVDSGKKVNPLAWERAQREGTGREI